MSRIETGVSAARVLGRALANLVGSSVDVIGTVTSVAQGRVTIETSDKASVTVMLNPGLKRSPGDIAAEQLSIGAIIEFVGTVNPDGSLSETDRFLVAAGFDLGAYGEMLSLASGKFASVGMF